MLIEYTPRKDLAEKLKVYFENVKSDGLTENDAMDLLVTLAIKAVNGYPRKRKAWKRE